MTIARMTRAAQWRVDVSKPRVKLWAYRGGWTQWIRPLHPYPGKAHRMVCCDCGLVHDMQFRFEVEKDEHVGVPLEFRYRVRRNDRATAATRRGADQRSTIRKVAVKLGLLSQ